MKHMNLPNRLTMLRILLVPFILLCFYLPASWGMWVAVVLFIGAGMLVDRLKHRKYLEKGDDNIIDAL